MFMSEKMKKAMALTALAENFGTPMSEHLAEYWLKLLDGYASDLVGMAVQKVIETHVYRALPPFAVLKSALDELAGVGEKALRLQAEAEWGVLLKAVEKLGVFRTPRMHPTTKYALELMGGWSSACCDWSGKDIDFKRRDFVQLWINAHGNIETMQLGADAVRELLTRHQGLVSSSQALGSVMTEFREAAKEELQ
jgi:hypothetical protein